MASTPAGATGCSGGSRWISCWRGCGGVPPAGSASGAGRLVESFGSKVLAETYLPKMYAGEWQGTMALTEPQAGSSLGDVKTEALPTDEGHYLLKGQKIFISAGDHDARGLLLHHVANKTKTLVPRQ